MSRAVFQVHDIVAVEGISRSVLVGRVKTDADGPHSRMGDGWISSLPDNRLPLDRVAVLLPRGAVFPDHLESEDVPLDAVRAPSADELQAYATAVEEKVRLARVELDLAVSRLDPWQAFAVDVERARVAGEVHAGPHDIVAVDRGSFVALGRVTTEADGPHLWVNDPNWIAKLPDRSLPIDGVFFLGANGRTLFELVVETVDADAVRTPSADELRAYTAAIVDRISEHQAKVRAAQDRVRHWEPVAEAVERVRLAGGGA